MAFRRIASCDRGRLRADCRRMAPAPARLSTKFAKIVPLALRIALGGWFVVSGGLKLWVGGLDLFTRQIGNYQLPFISPPWDAAAAYTVPWLEIVLGVMLVAGWWTRAVLGVLAGLVAVFAVCVGWAWARNLNIACGCLGGEAPIHYWGKVAEFAGYYLAIGVLWWRGARAE